MNKNLENRIDLKESNLNPNFIGSWMLEPTSICDDLIDYFELNQGKQRRGMTGSGQDINTKNSMDITILPKDLKSPGNEVFIEYFNALFSCHKDYLSQWPFLKPLVKNLHLGIFNLQRYQSGQHFQKIHTERSSKESLHRIFAWMTYLNNVNIEDGGSTHFIHYDIEVRPRKGLTLIWPADWTHAHKGNIINKGSKYIITGWMDFSE